MGPHIPLPLLVLAEDRLPRRWSLQLVDANEVLATYASPCGGTLELTLSSSRARLADEHACGAGGRRITLGLGAGVQVRVQAFALADVEGSAQAVDELLACVMQRGPERHSDRRGRRPRPCRI